MLTHEEVLEYIRLRRLGRIGVLWAEGGKLYFSQRPSANGFYRRDEAEFMTAREFLGHMTRAAFVMSRGAARALRSGQRSKAAA